MVTDAGVHELSILFGDITVVDAVRGEEAGPVAQTAQPLGDPPVGGVEVVVAEVVAGFGATQLDTDVVVEERRERLVGAAPELRARRGRVLTLRRWACGVCFIFCVTVVPNSRWTSSRPLLVAWSIVVTSSPGSGMHALDWKKRERPSAVKNFDHGAGASKKTSSLT